MRRPNHPAISFLPASNDDVPTLIRIHKAGFANDNAARLMFQNNDDYETTLRDMLKAQLSDPNVAVIMAVAKDTGSVLGWQACRFLGQEDALVSEGLVDVRGEREDRGHGRTLREVLREDAGRVQRDWMADRKYIHLDTRTYIFYFRSLMFSFARTEPGDELGVLL